MQFVLALLDHIRDPNYRDKTLSEIATETYYETLQKYHGWIVTGTFTVILKLVPNRDVFWNAITSNDDGESEQHRDDTMGQFCREFESLLSEIHSFLDSHGLDDPTKVWTGYEYAWIFNFNFKIKVYSLPHLWETLSISISFSRDENRKDTNDMFHHAKDESADFLPSLTESFKSIDVSQPIPTQQFVDACSKVQPIFDHIGR